jgi:hypothetical protein
LIDADDQSTQIVGIATAAKAAKAAVGRCNNAKTADFLRRKPIGNASGRIDLDRRLVSENPSPAASNFLAPESAGAPFCLSDSIFALRWN